MGEGSEHGARVGDEGDVARPRLAQIGEARGPDAAGVIVETHAVAAADRHVRAARHRSDALGQRRRAVVLEIAACENHPSASAVTDCFGERRLEPRIGDPEDREIDPLRQIREAAVAAPALDLGIVRVDRINRAGEA